MCTLVGYKTWYLIYQTAYVKLAINATVNVSNGQIIFMLMNRIKVIQPICLALSTSGNISAQLFA